MTPLPPVVCVIGKKKSGKTTTVVGLVAELASRGRRVMTLKHGHGFRLDTEGTDSWRHVHEGGAERVVMAGPEGVGVVGGWGPSGEPSLEELVARYVADADVVVAEGFKDSSAPRIEVYRRAVHEDPWLDPSAPPDPRYVAVLTDVPGLAAPVPVLDVDHPERFVRLADLVEARFEAALGRAPGGPS
ncbi:MAG: molybdopterin-guanine dinucleotide biosynthesis protein B [Longimicrobiales bacterium]